MSNISDSLVDLLLDLEEEDKGVFDTMIGLGVLMNHFPFLPGTDKAISHAI